MSFYRPLGLINEKERDKKVLLVKKDELLSYLPNAKRMALTVCYKHSDLKILTYITVCYFSRMPIHQSTHALVLLMDIINMSIFHIKNMYGMHA